MTGEPLSARRAYELGPVNRVVPTGEAFRAAVELANVICEAAPLSVRLSQRVVRATFAQGEEEALELQAQLGGELRQSEDWQEGPRSSRSALPDGQGAEPGSR
jgi:enoyl-CoA hydratase